MGRDGLEDVGDRMGVGFEGEADVLDSPTVAGGGDETAHVGDLKLPLLDAACSACSCWSAQAAEPAHRGSIWLAKSVQSNCVGS